MRRASIVLGVLGLLALTGCALDQPFTKIDAIGYHNQGFEKTIEVAGKAVDTNGDGRFDQYFLEKALVTNDASKTFEAQLQAQAMQYELLGAMMGNLTRLIETWMTLHYGHAPTTQPDESKFKDEILQEFLEWWREERARGHNALLT